MGSFPHTLSHSQKCECDSHVAFFACTFPCLCFGREAQVKVMTVKASRSALVKGGSVCNSSTSFYDSSFLWLPPQVLVPTSEFGYIDQDWPFWCGPIGPWWTLGYFLPCPMPTQASFGP